MNKKINKYKFKEDYFSNKDNISYKKGDVYEEAKLFNVNDYGIKILKDQEMEGAIEKFDRQIQIGQWNLNGLKYDNNKKDGVVRVLKRAMENCDLFVLGEWQIHGGTKASTNEQILQECIARKKYILLGSFIVIYDLELFGSPLARDLHKPTERGHREIHTLYFKDFIFSLSLFCPRKDYLNSNFKIYGLYNNNLNYLEGEEKIKVVMGDFDQENYLKEIVQDKITHISEPKKQSPPQAAQPNLPITINDFSGKPLIKGNTMITSFVHACPDNIIVSPPTLKSEGWIEQQRIDELLSDHNPVYALIHIK